MRVWGLPVVGIGRPNFSVYAVDYQHRQYRGIQQFGAHKALNVDTTRSPQWIKIFVGKRHKTQDPSLYRPFADSGQPITYKSASFGEFEESMQKTATRSVQIGRSRVADRGVVG